MIKKLCVINSPQIGGLLLQIDYLASETVMDALQIADPQETVIDRHGIGRAEVQGHLESNDVISARVDHFVPLPAIEQRRR